MRPGVSLAVFGGYTNEKRFIPSKKGAFPKPASLWPLVFFRNQCRPRFPFLSAWLGGFARDGANQLKSALLGETKGGVNQPDMGESLRKIPQLTFRPRIVFLGEQTDIVAHVEQALEKRARFFLAAE